MHDVLQWIEAHPTLLTSLFIASIIVFIASLFAVPLIIARIPADYFNHTRRPPARLDDVHPAMRLALRIARNILGGVLVLGGIAMLILPGQGILTIIIGALLIDGPGKYRLEKAIIRRPRIRRALDWLRRRKGQPPLIIDEHRPDDG